MTVSTKDKLIQILEQIKADIEADSNLVGPVEICLDGLVDLSTAPNGFAVFPGPDEEVQVREGTNRAKRFEAPVTILTYKIINTDAQYSNIVGTDETEGIIATTKRISELFEMSYLSNLVDDIEVRATSWGIADVAEERRGPLAAVGVVSMLIIYRNY